MIIAAAATTVTLGALLAGPHPASAHGELLQASPGPGQQVGGTLDFVDLAFAEPVSDALVEVTQNGVPAAGSMETAEGRIIRFRFDQPVSVAGRYDVSYTLTAGDGDRYAEVYNFTFQEGSPQAFRLGSTEARLDTGWSVRTIASIALVASLVLLTLLYLWRLESRRTGRGGHGPDRVLN